MAFLRGWCINSSYDDTIFRGRINWGERQMLLKIQKAAGTVPNEGTLLGWTPNPVPPALKRNSLYSPLLTPYAFFPADLYRKVGCIEIYAVSLLHERPCIVHVLDLVKDRKILEHFAKMGTTAPINLSYEGGDHYNSRLTPLDVLVSTHPGAYEVKRISEELVKTISINPSSAKLLPNAELDTLVRMKNKK